MVDVDSPHKDQYLILSTRANNRKAFSFHSVFMLITKTGRHSSRHHFSSARSPRLQHHRYVSKARELISFSSLPSCKVNQTGSTNEFNVKSCRRLTYFDLVTHVAPTNCVKLSRISFSLLAKSLISTHQQKTRIKWNQHWFGHQWGEHGVIPWQISITRIQISVNVNVLFLPQDILIAH